MAFIIFLYYYEHRLIPWFFGNPIYTYYIIDQFLIAGSIRVECGQLQGGIKSIQLYKHHKYYQQLHKVS